MRETGRSDGQMEDGLMMLFFNCRSIRNKVTELTSKLDELDIDIVCSKKLGSVKETS